MTPLIFVHIPKTAGTSFRIAAKKWFGKRQLLFDYGDAHRTSIIFRRYKAGKVGWSKVIEEVAQAHFVTGHFPASRYLSDFSPQHFCTFVRDPVKRAISQYRHHKVALGYTESFETFIEDPRFHDQQHRLLAGLKLDNLMFVGITEAYADSLQLFNTLYGTRFEVEVHNQYQGGDTDTYIELAPSIIKRIQALNPRDFKLHERASDILAKRLVAA